ncbi:outer membrane protein A [Enhygromyxa salina]|uniref:Outer membrane protein A n=1 Tax=Enhygromyxa salina TaxID=215803 RepID=A0A2S9XEY3_9BACT|nr:OmpA family protein [Enhygromyxa salina]PRP91424.1 outer membrane protein A [Enhygromyxa salina]
MSVEERTLPDGSVVCRTRAYAKREELPDTPDAASVVIGVSDCQEQAFEPEHSQLKDLTGRYQNDNWAANINQAGNQLCLWLCRLPNLLNERWGTVEEIYGEADNATGTSWGLYDASESLVGELKVLAAGKIEIHGEVGKTRPLVRSSTRATLSQRAIKSIAAVANSITDKRGGQMLDLEHQPYPAAWTHHLKETLLCHEFRAMMQEIVKQKPSGEMDTDLARSIRKLLTYIRDECAILFFGLQDSRTKFADLKGLLMAGWPTRDLFHTVVSLILQKEIKLLIPDGSMRNDTYQGWLERIVAFAKNNCQNLISNELRYCLSRFLGIYPKLHEYKLSIDALGTAYEVDMGKKISKKVGKKATEKFGDEWGRAVEDIVDNLQVHAGVKAFAGPITIESIDPPWSTTRAITLAFAGVGGGSSSTADVLKLQGTGSVRTPTVFGPEDFDGPLTVFRGITAHLDGQEMEMRLLIKGSGANAQVIANIDKLDTDLPGEALAHGWGAIFPTDDAKQVIDPPKMRFEDVTSGYIDKKNFQFHLSSATLRGNGHVALKKWAARELALLEDPKGDLQIMGFADRLGRKWYNDVLSESRAKNVDRALRAALGGRLAALTTVSSYGERYLALLDEHLHFPAPDNVASPEWRRVILLLSQQLALTFIVEENTP